jgi:hypothetical protein
VPDPLLPDVSIVPVVVPLFISLVLVVAPEPLVDFVLLLFDDPDVEDPVVDCALTKVNEVTIKKVLSRVIVFFIGFLV